MSLQIITLKSPAKPQISKISPAQASSDTKTDETRIPGGSRGIVQVEPNEAGQSQILNHPFVRKTVNRKTFQDSPAPNRSAVRDTHPTRGSQSPDHQITKSPNHSILFSWCSWLAFLFPNHFTAQFAPHHAELWQWLWSITLGHAPDPGAFIAIWPRGAGKSTNAEAACACLAARRQRRYGLYLSGTQEQADKHVQSVAAMLGAEGIEQHYPDIARREVNKYGHSQGWRRNRLHTASGFVLDALGLDVDSRGIKVRNQRPDFLIIDDVDSKHDTVAAVKKRIEILTSTIIPAGSRDLAILGIQNLIHRNSVFSQLADTRADFLLNRVVSGPFPALRNFAFQREGAAYVITAGEPTWSGQTVADCQRELNRIGPAAFIAECQQEIHSAAVGAVFPQYNEVYHVITWSEFAAFYGDTARHTDGRPRIPGHWLIGRAQDWGTTIQHPCATVWLARPGYKDRLDDSVFFYREMLFPEYPNPITTEVSPKKVGVAIVDAQRDWQEHLRINMSLISHEATAALNTYLNDMPPGYKLRFNKWKPDRLAGIAQLQNYLEIIDTHKPHPFRPQLLGRPRFYLVVEDSQGALIPDDSYEPPAERAWYRPWGRNEPAPASTPVLAPGWTVRQPFDARGLARARAELQVYHYPQTAQGQERDRPFKIFDDTIDALKALADLFFPRPARMTDHEKFEQTLPEHLRIENVEKLPLEQRFGHDFCRQTARIEYEYNKKQRQDQYLGWYWSLKKKYRDKGPWNS
jgi:hypothetical protein